MKIDRGKLKAVDKIGTQPYSIGVPQKKYYLGAYTQNDKIVVYGRIFQKHKTCDEHVKSKLRGMLAHEYTHYLDGYGKLSNLIGSANDEQTAIIGEHMFSELIWPNEKMIFTRALTVSERIKMIRIRNYLQEYRR
ncbi:MAG: hypothetical protein NT170_03875 [Candidatus Moranbacteria bacterium]|nr:hypothetical protein [Candidatus Moranbacteria bacterium]